MTVPVPDKRKGKPRILRRLPVRFGTDAKMCGGIVSDNSEGGMRIESPESFPVNSVITVFVQFPRHSVRLRVRVIWCRAAGGGAFFISRRIPHTRSYGDWSSDVCSSD